MRCYRVESFDARTPPPIAMTTPDPTLARYHRQMLLPGIGEEGQRRLLTGRAVIVGVGALGCALADHLARAGVGRLTLIDRDVVELTNLQRQTLFTESDVRENLPKAHAARRRLAEVNSGIHIDAHAADLTPANAERLLDLASAPNTILLDGTDNFETRYLLNDLAIKHRVPFAYAGVVASVATAMTIVPGVTPCLRCLGEKPPAGTGPTCDTSGVLGPAVAAIASFQAADAIKILAGRVDAIRPRLISLDLWNTSARVIDADPLGPRADCPCCGLRRFEFLNDATPGQAALCGQNAIQISPTSAGGATLDLAALAERWRPLGVVHLNPFLARLTLPPPPNPAHELTVFADGRAIVKGTTRPEVARSLYARYVGS